MSLFIFNWSGRFQWERVSFDENIPAVVKKF
jgi:hypothetical protein